MGKGKECLPMQETRVQSLGREDPLEKEMATHSNVFVWRIPWTKETVTPWAIVYGFSPWGHKELNTTEWLTLYWPYKQLLGAGVRHSAHGKGHEEGGSTYAKAGLSLRSPLGNPQASTPITRACPLYYFVLLPTPLSPTTSFGEGVNLELQLIIIPGRDRSVSTYKLLWRFSSLPTGLSGHMWLLTASQPWEARDALNLLKTGSLEKLENY